MISHDVSHKIHEQQFDEIHEMKYPTIQKLPKKKSWTSKKTIHSTKSHELPTKKSWNFPMQCHRGPQSWCASDPRRLLHRGSWWHTPLVAGGQGLSPNGPKFTRGVMGIYGEIHGGIRSFWEIWWVFFGFHGDCMVDFWEIQRDLWGFVGGLVRVDLCWFIVDTKWQYRSSWIG